jgi:DNA-binding NarL/FixJ family response regulator
LTRRLKSSHPQVRICVVSQFDLPEYREAARQSGADTFMLKQDLTDLAIVSLVHSLGNDPARHRAKSVR